MNTTDSDQWKAMMNSQTILIVDDERHITSIMKRRLEGVGFSVVEARDGAEALELVADIQPDAVVTDLQMPRISGLELAVALRKLESTSHVPVVMLTGRSHYVSEVALSKTNIKRIIEKPFSAREVVEAVQAVLNTPAQEAA
jgi:two-component system phosphate regulon response regulator PhoB